MPSTRRKRIPTPAPDAIGAPLSHAANVRMTEAQRLALWELQQARGLGYSEAIRAVIDEWREARQEGPSMNDLGQIPELSRPVAWDLETVGIGDQVQLVIEFEQDETPDSGHRVVMPMDRAEAHTLLDHLAERLAEADRAAES